MWHKERQRRFSWNLQQCLSCFPKEKIIVSPCLYDQLIFDKGGKIIQWSKESLLKKKTVLGEQDGTCKKKMKLDHHLTPYSRKNSKWIKDLNTSHDTIKILEENIGRKISDISYSNIFADISSRAKEIKEKINKWDYIKLKSFCTAKETIIKMKLTVWVNIFANNTLDKGLISKIYKEHKWLNTR